MPMPPFLDPTARLEKEIAAVTGPTCGYTCAHWPDEPCLRAIDHEGAILLVDRHVARVDDGVGLGPYLTTFGEECCA